MSSIAERASALENRLRKNSQQLKGFLKQEGVSCYRIFDWDMPECPLCIDVYEDNIHVAEYRTRHAMDDALHAEWWAAMVNAVQSFFRCEKEQLFLKVRERQKGRTQYEKVDQRQARYVVQESGLKFWVNLTDYLDTGLFLDHRPLRKQVRNLSEGKRVLNLFSYTGSFSVYAVAGGAQQVTTVDLSNTYLDWAKDNFKLNGFDTHPHEFIKTDAKAWLQETKTKPFDIIVLDPPTISRSKMSESKLDVQLDHVGMIQACLRLLNPGGTLFFSTNFRDFVLNENALSTAQIEDITLKSIPPDFRNKKIHYCWKIQQAQ
ncbi:MAG: methyltransferase [Chitinophagaceae bacterium]|nr:methyltransferase [Chitinophagaceae bacterium]